MPSHHSSALDSRATLAAAILPDQPPLQLLEPARLGRSTSLLFVDQGVSDYQSLIKDVQLGTEVYVLDPTQNAVQQITETLLGREGIASLQIVSHGTNGGLQLGHEWLNRYNLKNYAAQMQAWGQALTEDADMLLYGCNVAQDETGKAFVQLLSQLTGADVAASENVTGAGSDWTLEVSTGKIETASALSLSSRDHYQFTLNPTATLISNSATITENGAGSFTIALDSATSGDLTVNLSLDNGSTATSGDYMLSGASLAGSGSNWTIVIPDGSSSVTLDMSALAETLGFAEGDETLKLNLATGTGYEVSTNNDSASITIDANGFTVINTNDSAADYSLREGSLRQAIENANAISGTDSITFAGSTFTDAIADTITLTAGELGISSDLILDGTGANLLTLSGSNVSRVFNLSSGTGEINGVTIANGNSAGDGGGIKNAGNLTLNHTIIRNNVSEYGGGIGNTGGASLTVNHSTFSSNQALYGGAVSGYSAALTFNNSTFTGNSATAEGGAISNDSGSVIATNVTISGNLAQGNGGGIRLVDASGTLTNLTVTRNLADSDENDTGDGGGLYVFGGSVTVKNSIIAGNLDNSIGTSDPDVSGTMTDNGNNLIGRADGSTGFTNGVNGSLVGTIAAPIDPLLSVLGNYGGSTQTHALLPGSAAINAGTSTGAPTTDQRGINRVGAVDIGAFESRGFTLAITGGNNQSTKTNTAFANPLKVKVTANDAIEPIAGGKITFVSNGGEFADATFPNPVATVDLSGNAQVIATANGVAGSYTIATSSNGTPSVSFSLTNTQPVLPSVAIAPVSTRFQEGNHGTIAHTFKVTLSASSTEEITVDYTTADGSATVLDGDYIPDFDTLIFAAGETEKTITIYSNGDTRLEADETFKVNLTSATAATVSSVASATGTLLNDDLTRSTYRLSSQSFAIGEGNSHSTANVVTLSRSGNLEATSFVDVVLTAGSATAGRDFVAQSIRVNFAIGQQTAIVPVQILGDREVEANETIRLALVNPSSNSTIDASRASATLTLTNDDQALPASRPQSYCTYSFSAKRYRTQEGSKLRLFDRLTVVREGDLSKETTIGVKQANGKVINVTFKAGSRTAVVPIKIRGNSKAESDRKLRLSLTNLGEWGKRGKRTRTTLEIRDDDRFRRNRGRSGFRLK